MGKLLLKISYFCLSLGQIAFNLLKFCSPVMVKSSKMLHQQSWEPGTPLLVEDVRIVLKKKKKKLF